jgi:hypothetical protein
MADTESDCEYLYENSVTVDRLKSAVVLMAYRGMLRDHRSKQIEKCCREYIGKVVGGVNRSDKPEAGKVWCRAIIQVLRDALDGNFYDVDLGEKAKSVENYDGVLKKYISRPSQDR